MESSPTPEPERKPCKYFLYDEANPHGPALFLCDLAADGRRRIRVASKFESVASMDLAEAERLQGVLGGLNPSNIDGFREALSGMIEELEAQHRAEIVKGARERAREQDERGWEPK